MPLFLKSGKVAVVTQRLPIVLNSSLLFILLTLEAGDNLGDFGIDSLLGLELQAELKTAVDRTPDDIGILGATSIRDLVKCLLIAMGVQHQPPGDQSLDETGSTPQPSDYDWRNESSDESMLTSPVPPDLLWSISDILKYSSDTKKIRDKMIKEFGLDDFGSVASLDSTRVCTAHVVEPFEELGCLSGSALAGESLVPVSVKQQQKILMNSIYNFLETTVGLVAVAEMGSSCTPRHLYPGEQPRYPPRACG